VVMHEWSGGGGEQVCGSQMRGHRRYDGCRGEKFSMLGAQLAGGSCDRSSIRSVVLGRVGKLSGIQLALLQTFVRHEAARLGPDEFEASCAHERATRV
jgi:hypothetical protein